MTAHGTNVPVTALLHNFHISIKIAYESRGMSLTGFFNSRAFKATATGLATVLAFAGTAGLVNKASDGEILNAFLENRDTITLHQDIKDISTAEAEAKINTALDLISEHRKTGAALVKMARDEGVSFFGTRQMDKGTMAYYSLGKDLVGFNPDAPQGTLIKNLCHELTHFYQDQLNMFDNVSDGEMLMVAALEFTPLAEAQAGAIEQRIKWDLHSAGIEGIWGDIDNAHNNFMEWEFQKGLAEAVEAGLWGEEAADMATKAAYESFFKDEGIMVSYMNDTALAIMEYMAEGKMPGEPGRHLTREERMQTTLMPQGHNFSNTVPDAFSVGNLRLEHEFRMLMDELEAQRRGGNTNASFNRYAGLDIEETVKIFKNTDGNITGGILGAAQHAQNHTTPKLDDRGFETDSNFTVTTPRRVASAPSPAGPG